MNMLLLHGPTVLFSAGSSYSFGKLLGLDMNSDSEFSFTTKDYHLITGDLAVEPRFYYNLQKRHRMFAYKGTRHISNLIPSKSARHIIGINYLVYLQVFKNGCSLLVVRYYIRNDGNFSIVSCVGNVFEQHVFNTSARWPYNTSY